MVQGEFLFLLIVSVFGGIRLLIVVVLMLFFSVICISLVRDDLLQLKRIEPTNCKKLTAVRIFLIRVGSHGIDQVLSSHTR